MSAADPERSQAMSQTEQPTRRLPNPWVAIPVLIAAAVGYFVGSRVAGLSCGTDGCTGEQILWGTMGAAVGFIGVLIVSVLVVRSLAEWAALSEADKARRSRRDEPPVC